MEAHRDRKRVKTVAPGLIYQPGFLRSRDRDAVLKWLAQIHPLWEARYSHRSISKNGQTQRYLLRPVYWLGNWQFACLNYYHPPKGVWNRCVEAEPYPPVLKTLVQTIEAITRATLPKKDIPPGWSLNTCLINLYGRRYEEGRKIDGGRVGEHKDYEPGPVASLSLGERALFQFVSSRGRHQPAHVAFQLWLEDGSLQIFGGERWKNLLFHRVQRVERKGRFSFKIGVENFETRRVNFTFRYVPEKHIVPYAQLDSQAAMDIRPYVEELARYSPHFKRSLGHIYLNEKQTNFGLGFTPLEGIG